MTDNDMANVLCEIESMALGALEAEGWRNKDYLGNDSDSVLMILQEIAKYSRQICEEIDSPAS